MPYLIILLIMSIIFTTRQIWRLIVTPLQMVASYDRATRISGWILGYIWYILLMAFVSLFIMADHPHFVLPDSCLLVPGVIFITVSVLSDWYRAAVRR